jgi:CelD/BcsL family acetyltransferase involved in cellulose biosynthesis
MHSPGVIRSLAIDARPVTDMARLAPYWRDLAARALEPNPFAESAFLIPAGRRIAQRKLIALCVWDGPGRMRLEAIAVLRLSAASFGIADLWRSEQAPLSALLVDREFAAPALESMVGWLAPRAIAFGVSHIDVGGSLAHALRALSANRALRLDVSNRRQRAALRCGPGGSFETLLRTKRRKEWGRLRRRLEEQGEVRSEWSASDAAIEDFLRLEASGWKGDRGTALVADRNRAAFAREMLSSFAADNRLRIARLMLDGRPIAAGAVLVSGPRAYYWKTAFDPAYAQYSPGVLLTLAMSRDLEADPGLTLVDSCADPDHPMIDRIWTDRIDLADFVLQTRPGSTLAFKLAIEARRARAAAREHVKRLAGPWRR